MEIKDLQVGQKFMDWNLGFQVQDNHGDLTEELKSFFRVITIEKVNKVTFVANGQKFTEIPKSWRKFNLEFARTFAILKAKFYFSNVDQLGRLYCEYNTKYYKKFLLTLTPEEKAEFKSGVQSLITEKMEKYKDAAIKLRMDKLDLTLGDREPRWDER